MNNLNIQKILQQAVFLEYCILKMIFMWILYPNHQIVFNFYFSNFNIFFSKSLMIQFFLFFFFFKAHFDKIESLSNLYHKCQDQRDMCEAWCQKNEEKLALCCDYSGNRTALKAKEEKLKVCTSLLILFFFSLIIYFIIQLRCVFNVLDYLYL